MPVNEKVERREMLKDNATVHEEREQRKAQKRLRRLAEQERMAQQRAFVNRGKGMGR